MRGDNQITEETGYLPYHSNAIAKDWNEFWGHMGH